MKNKIILSKMGAITLLAMLATLLSISIVSAAGFQEIRITTDPNAQEIPAIYEDKIVWQDNRDGNWDIYMYNLSVDTDRNGIPNYLEDLRPSPDPAEIAICNESHDQQKPVISDDIIVWQDNRNGNWDIYYKDLTMGNEYALCTASGDQTVPDIFEKWVVWQDMRVGTFGRIYLYDLSAGPPSSPESAGELVGGGPGTNTLNRQPAVWGDSTTWWVVWSQLIYGTADWDIVGNFSGSFGYVTTDPKLQILPDIYENNVVWVDNRNGPNDIYMRNLTSGGDVSITTAPGSQRYPHIYGNRVVWQDDDTGDIYECELETMTVSQVSTASGNQQRPAVYGARIVWQDDRNGNWDIYMNKIKILTLYIEDASAKTLVNKAPGDRIDIVAAIKNNESFSKDINVTSGVPSDLVSGGLIANFTRNNFTDTDEKPIDCTKIGNNYTVTVKDLPAYASKQVVWRFNISDAAPTTLYNVTGYAEINDAVCDSDSQQYNVVYSIPGIIVTNRHLLYKKYGSSQYDANKVQSLLRYLYEVADGNSAGEKSCIVYYVDHYDETLKEWDQQVDYSSESTANDIVNTIDELIEDRRGQTGSYYLMIIGGDEIIPFYRADDPTNVEAVYSYNSDDPVLDAMDHDYFISDDIYADTDDKDWNKGELEIITGRIVGCSAKDMENFIGNGIDGPVNDDNATVASLTEVGGREWDADWAIAELEKKKTITDKGILNDNHNWGQNELITALQKGFQVFAYFAHGEYNAYQTPNLQSDEIDIVDSNGCISNNRPFIANDGCRLGIVTDENGATWGPEWDDCMMYALVHHGISGAFSSGGIMWWWTGADVAYYGELFGNDFFKELKINTGTTTLPVGEAFMRAKVNYNPKHPNFDNYDKKTMMEYILYGVPWMTMDPKISEDNLSQENSSQVSVKISDPILLPDGNYSRSIEINVTDFNISHLNGFDIISIEGAEQKGGILKPEIPTAAVSMLLPLNTIVTEVELIDNITAYLGKFNIPCSGVILGTNAIGYTNETDVVGYYPVPTYNTDISAFEDYELVRVYVALVQHNLQTNETILYNYTKIEFTYQTPTPIAITDFSTDKYRYATGEPINTTVTVENVGASNLSGLRANLTLKNLYGQIQASTLSSEFEVSPGGSETIPVNLSATVPDGTYLAEVRIVNSTDAILGMSSEYIHVSSGEITDFILLEEVELGDEITFEISFKNSNSTDVEATGRVYLYDKNDIEVAELSADPVTIGSNSVVSINITWNTIGKETGKYTASAMVSADGKTFGPVSETFAIVPIDVTPPIITHVITTSITNNSATIIWDTDEVSDSLVKYGTEPGNYTMEEHNAAYVTSHSIDLSGLMPNMTYYYVVNSTDPSDNSAQSAEYNFTTKMILTCKISLTKGWNLISVPLNLTTWELGEESAVGDPLKVTPKNSLTSIYRYNITSGLFEKCSHYDDWGWWPATGSESFTELEPGRGYWVMAKNDCNLTFTGTEPSDLNITLSTSWNLVGWYSMEEALLGQESVVGDPLTVTPKNSLSSIYRYNSSTGLFEKCSHYDDWGWWPATGSESFTKLEPGKGYWVMVKNDCEWRHKI